MKRKKIYDSDIKLTITLKKEKFYSIYNDGQKSISEEVTSSKLKENDIILIRCKDNIDYFFTEVEKCLENEVVIRVLDIWIETKAETFK